jgi:DNA polymerase III epsilon subunit family exonuclease
VSAARPDGGLLARAARLLTQGPVHTLEVAHEVLGLSGNPSAASAAVFTLLGRDDRFQVDEAGRWSLASEGGPLPGPSLLELEYAVVDVETTGGNSGRAHRVTEVGLVPVVGGRVEEGFQSLINPGRSIPPRIQGLTGITDDMVLGAPSFEAVAPRLSDALQGRVFVAHNVQFDWGFIQREILAATGEAPTPPLLCTVRMSRLLLPRMRSYGLDAVTRHLGVPVHHRHRAYGDALATARVLLHLLLEAHARGIHDLHALQALLQPGSRRSRRGPAPKDGARRSTSASAPFTAEDP